MSICNECWGKGWIEKQGVQFDCRKCKGTGVIENEPQTNDEWRKTCSTEEFAEFLSDVVFNAIVDYRIDKDNCEKEDGNYWLKWLKQPHKKEQ